MAKKEEQYYRIRVKFYKLHYKNLFQNLLVVNTTRTKAVEEAKKALDEISKREKVGYEITKIENLKISMVI